MSSSVVTSAEAYTKVILHCSKHCTQPVMGMLLGKPSSSSKASHASSNQNTSSEDQQQQQPTSTNTTTTSAAGCYVADAIPLFHSGQMSAPHPMLEVALAHVQSAAKTRGLVVLGVYLANERLDDKTVNAHSAAVLDDLSRRLSSSGQKLLVWFVDNTTLTSPPTELSVTAYYHESGSSKSGQDVAPPSEGDKVVGKLKFGVWNTDTLSPDAQTEESGLAAVAEAQECFAQYGLLDFEDHLENPQLDYLNQDLAKLKKRS